MNKINKKIIQETNPEDLLSIVDASKVLGKGFSRSSMLRRIDNGDWLEGIHWINDSPKRSKKRIIKINIKVVQHERRSVAIN